MVMASAEMLGFISFSPTYCTTALQNCLKYLESPMHIARLIAIAGVVLMLIASCVTTQLAPGADKVHITQVTSDVSHCIAVGNIRVAGNADGSIDTANAEAKFRNQAIGLGGNTALQTEGVLGVPVEGIAYRCP
jgi:hypothetical protein